MSRNWCFTLNNYSEEEIQSIPNWKCAYVIYGKEVGENGTPHLQGYCELNKVCRLSAMKKLNERAHWESRKGTQKQARDYCMEDGDWVEFGVLKKQGERNDLDKIRQQAEDDGMRGVTRNRNAQQIRVAEKYLTYNEEPRDWKPEVYWLWGKTGTGKSRMARELCNVDDCYVKNDGTKWWEGYDGHECVIIDDFRDSWWALTEMLALLDRYEKRVEYKGGSRQFRPRLIVVTCAVAPDECYRGTGERIDQLLRRIDHIKELELVTEVL